jgi:DNA-directed RNA polymerase specialized sigma24 family protein
VATTDEDEDIRLKLVAGSDDDIRDAFERIDKEYRVPICAWVRKNCYPGMSVDDLAEMWQDTMVELLKKVRDGKYGGNQRVFSDLCQIISRNTIDSRRKHRTRDRVLDDIGKSLAGTLTGERWKSARPEERLELLELIRQEGARLPEKQRQVLEALISHFPETEDMQVLRMHTSELTGKEETLAAVKGAIAVVRRKLRGVLTRKGYGFSNIGDDDEQQ